MDRSEWAKLVGNSVIEQDQEIHRNANRSVLDYGNVDPSLFRNINHPREFIDKVGLNKNHLNLHLP